MFTISLKSNVSFWRHSEIRQSTVDSSMTWFLFVSCLPSACFLDLSSCKNTCKNHAQSFGDSEKGHYFLGAPKWKYKHEKMWKKLFNFLNNTSKTCSFELKISRNIEIHYALHLKYIFIHVTHFTQVALLP